MLRKNICKNQVALTMIMTCGVMIIIALLIRCNQYLWQPAKPTIIKHSLVQSIRFGYKQGTQSILRMTPMVFCFMLAFTLCKNSGLFSLICDSISMMMPTKAISPNNLAIALARPFSGATSLALFASMLHDNSNWNECHKAALFLGSSETTFYVISVYFSAINVKKTRYSIPVGLISDFIALVIIQII